MALRILSVFLFCVLLSTFAMADGPSDANDLSAFTPDPSVGLAPLEVAFLENVNSRGQYAWDFGDGGTSSATEPSYVYTTPGTYTVTLTVTDGFSPRVYVCDACVQVLEPLLVDGFDQAGHGFPAWRYYSQVYQSSTAAILGAGGAAIPMRFVDGGVGDQSTPQLMQTEEGFLLGGGGCPTCDQGDPAGRGEVSGYFSWYFDLSSLEIKKGGFELFHLFSSEYPDKMLLKVKVRKESGAYTLDYEILDALDIVRKSVSLGSALTPFSLELEWMAGDVRGGAGSFKALLTSFDGRLRTSTSAFGVKNHGSTFDRFRLGLMNGFIHGSLGGELKVDEFVAIRGVSILP